MFNNTQKRTLRELLTNSVELLIRATIPIIVFFIFFLPIRSLLKSTYMDINITVDRKLNYSMEHNGKVYPKGIKLPTFTVNNVPVPPTSIELKNYEYDKETHSLLKVSGEQLFKIPDKFDKVIDANEPMPVIEVKAGEYQIYWIVSKEEVKTKSVPLSIDDLLELEEFQELEELNYDSETKTVIVISTDDYKYFPFNLLNY